MNARQWGHMRGFDITGELLPVVRNRNEVSDGALSHSIWIVSKLFDPTMYFTNH